MTDAEIPDDETPRFQVPEGPSAPASDATAGGTHVELPPEDWEQSDALGLAEVSAQEMASYRVTISRIERMILVAGAIGATSVIWPLGWTLAIGMFLGTVLGWINFRWLSASVNAIGERIVNSKSRERGAAVVARGVGRIFLIALFAYVIFTYSVRGLIGFLIGLAMPVVAMMCEAGYEFVASNRRSS